MLMLTSRSVTPPAGTFLAKVRNGAIQLPLPIRLYCDASGWNLFRVTPLEDWRLEIAPVIGDDNEGEFHSSLSPEGILWIPGDLRTAVALGEQSVMIRVDSNGIHVYLRKVFETLGFRP